MFSSVEPFSVPAGDGTLLETPNGDSVCIKTDTRNTSGSLAVLEFVIAPQNGPGLHTHVREDEVWHVLEGDFRFKAGDVMFEVSEGGMAFGPRGIPHNFQNIGGTPGRLLVDRSRSPSSRRTCPCRSSLMSQSA